MKESALHHLAAPFHDMCADYSSVLSSYKHETGKRIFAFTCDCLPFEVLSASGVLPLKIPFSMASESASKILPYDLLVHHEGCPGSTVLPDLQDVPAYCCPQFHGYGEDASIELHEILGALLKDQGLPDTESISNDAFREATIPIDEVRKCIRGISGLRREKPDLLSNADLFTVFDAAMCFPPDLVLDHLRALRDAMNEETSRYRGNGIPVLVNGWTFHDFPFLDEIEEEGLLVAEDDICGGRRQFDLSFNTASGYLYYEILHSFSFKPMCPPVRPPEERFELLYRLLRNHGIFTVLFLPGEENGLRKTQVDYLRKKLMRSGVDPIVMTGEQDADTVRSYLQNVSL